MNTEQLETQDYTTQMDITTPSAEAKHQSEKPQSITSSKPSEGKPARNKKLVITLLFLIVMLFGVLLLMPLPAAECANRKNQDELTVELVLAAENLNQENHNEATKVLLSIVERISVVEINRLLQKGANVNGVDDSGQTPLMVAAQGNLNPEVLRTLIKNGANANAVDNIRETPLMKAAQSNSNPDVVRTLIENGANVNAADENRETSLMKAVQSNSNPDVMRTLIENGANVNAVGNNGRTPLMYAASHNPNPEILRVLIMNSARVNVVCENGETPLMKAAQGNSNPDVLRILIENGARVNVESDSGETALMKAAQENTNPDVLRVLIENRANVNAIDRSDWTPLMNAARFNSNPSILRALVENGAKVNAVNMHNWTPLMLACINNSSPEVIRLLIENGANINAESENRETTLMIAAEGNSNPEVLRLLIENGADVNAENDNGETPLMKAAKGNPNPEVLRFLIENGVRVNIIGNDGKTPLIKAAEYNSSPRILRLLIENGADVSIKDKEGRRAFDYAEGNERLKSEYALYLRETMVESDVNLNLYHPWSESANIPDLDYPSFLRKKYNYPKLDTPATLLISGDYPKLDGATSSYPIYAAVTNEVFAISNKKELQRYLFCSKTENAYDRLVHGEVDIIFVLQPSDEQLQSAKDAGIELNFIPIAKDAFVFFVNKLNPVSNLTVEQIRNIYIKKITNWRIVGGKNREIVSYQRPANSGSQTAMIKEIMKGEKLPSPVRKRVHIANTMLQMVLEVAQDDEESIGYSFRFFTEEMMRDVWGARKNKVDYFQLLIDLISKNDTESRVKHEKYRNEIRNVMMNPVKLISVNGIAPSEENIRNGTYPFTVDVYAVTARTSNPHAQDLIDWMLSPQGQELIEKAGYVGVMTNRD